MSRPGFVLEVDDRTPPLLVHEGLGFRMEDFPLGTRVVYPPESLPSVSDVDEAIREALLNPTDSEPLPELLTPGMRLTIAFDDVSLTLPTMRAPDVRQRIIEQVLTMAAAADLSAAWFRELEIVGTYASAQSEPAADGRSSFDVALELAGHDTVATLAKTVAPYPLHRWREALDHAQSAGRLGTVKVAFDPRKRG